jgi:hypothetical protein
MNSNLFSFNNYAVFNTVQKILKKSLNLNESNGEYEKMNEDDFYQLDMLVESSDLCTLDVVCMNEPENFSSDYEIYESSAPGWLVKTVNEQINKIKPDVKKAIDGLSIDGDKKKEPMPPKTLQTINKVVDMYIKGLKKALAKGPKSSEELYDIANKTPEHKYVVNVLVNTYGKVLKDNESRAQSSLFSEDNKRSSMGIGIIQTAIKEVVFNIKETGNKNGEKNNVPKAVTDPKPWSSSDIPTA